MAMYMCASVKLVVYFKCYPVKKLDIREEGTACLYASPSAVPPFPRNLQHHCRSRVSYSPFLLSAFAGIDIKKSK